MPKPAALQPLVSNTARPVSYERPLQNGASNAVTSPDTMDQIPSEAPETAEPEAPPLVLSEREMLLPTFASSGRGSATAEAPQTTSLFSRRAPLTLSVPRSEAQPGRLTLSIPSGFTPDPLPTAKIASPALNRVRVKALIAKTVMSHRIGAEHPAIAALTLEGKAPLAQAEALRKLPHGQRRRIHRALRQVEAA